MSTWSERFSPEVTRRDFPIGKMADDGKVPRTVNLFRVFRGGGCYHRDELIFPVAGCYPEGI